MARSNAHFNNSFGEYKSQRIKTVPITPVIPSALGGIIVLVGYGISVHVNRGHLSVEDGIGPNRRKARFSRVHHGLRRVVVIGSDGSISLEAIRWMADQDIALVMLERDGKTLLSIGPTALSDTRLRRAQACAQHSPVAIDIVRHLVSLKLKGQAALLRDGLKRSNDADLVKHYAAQLVAVNSIDGIRQLEAKGASIYWLAWEGVAARFPKNELLSVPEHWQTFGTRRSPLTFNARRATNPINAILNYLYTVLESETRLAISALGLDPGFGLLHVDTAKRDSLVYDLMEPIRPSVDAYVLALMAQTPLKRSYFFEERDGMCRLMASITTQLSETAMSWSREVAPIVEWFAQELCSGMLELNKVRGPGTRLTQQRRKTGKGLEVAVVSKATPKQKSLCQTCGQTVSEGCQFCGVCAVDASTRAIPSANKASKTPEALRRRADKMLAQCEARRNWSPSHLPEWLSKEAYITRIQPLLAGMARTKLEAALGVSAYYARGIATGKIIPHQRHWVGLAELAGVTPSGLI